MFAPAPMKTDTSTTSASAGGRIVAADGRELPLRSVHLTAQAGGGIARVVITQRFENPYDEPLEVRYLLPLPSDGAVSGFSFVLGDVRVKGQVEGKQVARERYHAAIAQGKTAALLEQERTALFTQRVGNVPPRCELVAEITVDQPLRWLDEGAWEWRFPTVVGARYMGGPGRVADAAALSVPVAPGSLPVGASLALVIEDGLTGPVESASHAIEARIERVTDVRFDGDGAVRLDRDVVVRWPVALPAVSCNVIAARPAGLAHDGDAFALVTVAPPTGGMTAVPRDLTFLIDASGSMSGRPLDQCKRVVAAMIETLGIHDRIEIIEFASRPRRWKDAPQLATDGTKQEALAWVRGMTAGGSTEMSRAVLEALRPLRADSQRQVVLLTDGYIGFEQEIVRTLLTALPAGARLHTVGVGSSVNRSLTQAAARAGRGTELIIGIDEDPERAVIRLLARTTAPLVTELSIEGAGVIEVAPKQLPDLYAEAPALIALRLRGAGGTVVVRGRTAGGAFEQRLTVPALERGQGNGGVAALYAREKVEDLETALTAGGSKVELDRTIEATGIEFQIASRLTSWVAVSQQVTVVAPARQVEQPHELPHGVSAEGLGLRPAQGALAQTAQAQTAQAQHTIEDLKLQIHRGAMTKEEATKLYRSQGVAPGRAAPARARSGSSGGGFGAPPPAAAPPAGYAAPPGPPAANEKKKSGAFFARQEPPPADAPARPAGPPRPPEPIRLTDELESSEELILEDSTPDTVIDVGSIMGGAKGTADVRFDSTEEYAAKSGEAMETEAFELMDGSDDERTGEHVKNEAGEAARDAAPEEAASIVRRITSKRMLPPADQQLTRTGVRMSDLTPQERAWREGVDAASTRAAKARSSRQVLLLLLLIVALVLAIMCGAWLGDVIGGDPAAPPGPGVTAPDGSSGPR